MICAQWRSARCLPSFLNYLGIKFQVHEWMNLIRIIQNLLWISVSIVFSFFCFLGWKKMLEDWPGYDPFTSKLSKLVVEQCKLQYSTGSIILQLKIGTQLKISVLLPVFSLFHARFNKEERETHICTGIFSYFATKTKCTNETYY